MSFEDRDKKLMDLFKKQRSQRPPEYLTKNFEDDVMHKIHASEAAPMAVMVPAVCLGLAVAALVIFFVLQTKEPAVVERKIAAEVIDTAEGLKPAADAPKTGRDSLVKDAEPGDAYDSLSEDLLILQILEEDEGLIDDLEFMETDLEIFSQLTPAIAAM